MKMNALAHAAIDRLELIHLRLEPCTVPAKHRFMMQPVPTERFIYIKSGSVYFFLEKGEFHAKARDMVYLPCETAYRSLWQSEASFIVVDLLLRDGEGQEIRFGDAPGVLFCDAHRVYEGLLEELAEKEEATDPFDWLERLSLSFKLLCEIARDTNRQELDQKTQRIKEGITYLESHFAENFSVDRLAELCSLSVSAFRRSFAACKGMSPVAYRNVLRIRRATELLKSGNYTVSEAAEQVGIYDVKYFSKLYKQHTGLNPGIIKKSRF